MAVATVQLTNGQTVKLGRNRPKLAFDYGNFRVREYDDGHRVVTLRLAAYFDPAQATALPDSTNRREKATASLKRMYKNDQYGDCVIASAYHQTGLWSGADTGNVVLGTDEEVVSAYHRICGPGDNGCNIGDVLNARKNQGLSFNGAVHKIDDFVSIDHTNKDLVKAAIFLLGSGPIGINLPDEWRRSGDGGTWDVTNSGIVGGHDVPAVDYEQSGVNIATWAGLRVITWPAFMSKRWIDEFDIVLSPDWYNDDQLAPNGINVTKLKEDLAMLANGQIPPIDVPPPPLIDFANIGQ